MKIIGDEAVQNPSVAEAAALAQVNDRKMEHLMRNLAQKATSEERRAKRLQSLRQM